MGRTRILATGFTTKSNPCPHRNERLAIKSAAFSTAESSIANQTAQTESRLSQSPAGAQAHVLSFRRKTAIGVRPAMCDSHLRPGRRMLPIANPSQLTLKQGFASLP